jgi:hypothetical protein
LIYPDARLTSLVADGSQVSTANKRIMYRRGIANTNVAGTVYHNVGARLDAMCLLNLGIKPKSDMRGLQSKKVMFFLVFVLPLVLLGVILGALQLGTRALVSLEQAVRVGYSVAVFIWLSFVLSIIAHAALISIVAFNTFNDKPISKKLVRTGVGVGTGVVVVAFLVIQFGTHLLTPLEIGIANGGAPPGLVVITSLLALFGIVETFFYNTKFRSAPVMPHTDGGIKTLEAVVAATAAPPSNEAQHSSAHSEQLGIRSQARPTTAETEKPLHNAAATQPVESQASSSAPQAPSSNTSSILTSNPNANSNPNQPPPSQEPAPTVTIQDLKLLESFVSRRDFDLLVGQTQTSEDKDLIQTKANIAEWILLSLRMGGKVTKTKLESNFEEQFPKIYVPLFNAVLYDLIYKNKVDSIREGSRMILFLKEES